MKQDDSQSKAINAFNGYYLVLAPPGCGKTNILAYRIDKAHKEFGVQYEQMLCLTFTNRAARGMVGRIEEKASENANEVFVGNVHRFCSQFLFKNHIVPMNTSIIDEVEQEYIMLDITIDYFRSQHLGEYDKDWGHLTFMDDLTKIIPDDFSGPSEEKFATMVETVQHIMHAIIYGYPLEIVSTPSNRINKYFIDQFKDLFSHQFVFQEPDKAKEKILELVRGNKESASIRHLINIAWLYFKEKKDKNLLDFEDLLQMAYDNLTIFKNDEYIMSSYKWIQVDEVQDLNAMQFALIDLLTDKSDKFTVMYLGDEQQAIFSFMGAGIENLNKLNSKCGEKNILRLETNHRSPDYLVELLNEYAEEELRAKFLPKPDPDNFVQKENDSLQIYGTRTQDRLSNLAMSVINYYLEHYPNERTSLLVNKNSEADYISRLLTEKGINHFKFSGEDFFRSLLYKLILAHFSVIQIETNYIAWANILQMVLNIDRFDSKQLSFLMRDLAMTPSDLMLYDNSSYLIEFVKDFDSKEMVVFDTETTGLDVFSNDIIQIAAFKIKGGKKVQDSDFNRFLKTDQTIPPVLNRGKINPMVDVYKKAKEAQKAINSKKEERISDPKEALEDFIKYIGDDILVGQNIIDYDLNILKSNLERNGLPSKPLFERKFYDTLLLMRREYPRMRKYNLESLINYFELEGVENTHDAREDIEATFSAMKLAYDKAYDFIEGQEDFLGLEETKKQKSIIVQSYRDIFLHSKDVMWEKELLDERVTLANEMQFVKNQFLKTFKSFLDKNALTKIVERRKIKLSDFEFKFEKFLSYINIDLIDGNNSKGEDCLGKQLSNHITDLSTLKEGDLADSTIMKDTKLFVTTVHKAKGLEWENVIVYNTTTDDWYPNFYEKEDIQRIAEKKRLLYVAMSRAVKRLALLKYNYFNSGYNLYSKGISVFLLRHLGHFHLNDD